ncbi:MAG: transposase [Leptolyngbyaceae cyanobacterium RM1_1_2]|nr:transposase [Leptolyngbyaceae cyanobacterium RM1_1_2]
MVEISPAEVSVPRRRRRSRGQDDSEEGTQLPLLKSETDKQTSALPEDSELKSRKAPPTLKDTNLSDHDQPVAAALEEPEKSKKAPPTLKDADLDDSDLSATDDDYDDDLDEEDEDSEESEWDQLNQLLKPGLEEDIAIEIIPLTQANLPKTCYLVVDRIADLITRPLKEFSELGQIPASGVEERTLPVFDNHRVARRFSQGNQRVVKVPDGNIFQKTSRCLQAKGITHLLIDGQMYSLDGSWEEN